MYSFNSFYVGFRKLVFMEALKNGKNESTIVEIDPKFLDFNVLSTSTINTRKLSKIIN